MAPEHPNGFGLEEEYFDSPLPLLTREEELTYAKDIERTRREFTHAILSTPLGIRRALETLHDIQNGVLPFGRFIRASQTEPAYATKNGQPVSLSESAIHKRLPSTLRQLDILLAQHQYKEMAHIALTLPLDIDKVHIPVLKELRTTATHQRLTDKYATYNQARHNLANGNHRLVKFFANKYIGKGVSRADLCGEGEIGLLRAVDKFEWRMGFKFGTYATWWIRQAMQRAVDNQSSTIRIPLHNTELETSVRSYLTRFQEEYGRSPRNTDGDIWRLEALSGISEEALREYFQIFNLRNTRNFDDLMPQNKPDKGTPDESFTLGSILKDTHTAEVPLTVHQNDIRDAVIRVLRTISLTCRLPFKIRNGIALTDEDDTSIPERSLLKAIIRHRNGHRLTKDEKELLLSYLDLQGKRDIKSFPVSKLGRAPVLADADDQYLGSLLVRKSENPHGHRRRRILKPVDFFEGATYTLDEVSTIFAVTRERIRQLETQVFKKLKNSERQSMLQPYADAALL